MLGMKLIHVNKNGPWKAESENSSVLIKYISVHVSGGELYETYDMLSLCTDTENMFSAKKFICNETCYILDIGYNIKK